MIDLKQLDEQIHKWGTSFLGFHADMQPDFERAILDAFSGLLPFDVPDHISPVAQALFYRFLFDPQLVHFDEHVLWEGMDVLHQAIATNQEKVKNLLEDYRQQFWTAVISLMRLTLWWPTVKYSMENREDFIFRHLVPNYVLTFESVYRPLITMMANWNRISRKKEISYTSVNNAMQDLPGHDIFLREGLWQVHNSDDADSTLEPRGFRRIIRNSMAHSDFHIYDETQFSEFMVFPNLGAKGTNDEPFFYDEQVIGIYEELLDDCSALALCLVWAEERLGLLSAPEELTSPRSRRAMESKLHVLLKCVLEPSGTKIMRAWSQRLNGGDRFYAQLRCFPSKSDGKFALLRAAACAQSLVNNADFCATVEAGIPKLAWISGLFMADADEMKDSLASPKPPKSNSRMPDREVVALGMLKNLCEMSARFRFAYLGVKWQAKLKALQKLKDRFNWPLPRRTARTISDRSVQVDDLFQIVHAKGCPANTAKEVEFAIICPKAIDQTSLREHIPDLVYRLREHDVTFPNPHSDRHWKGTPAEMLTACFYLRRPREDVLASGRCSERKCAIAKVEWHRQGKGPYWVESHETLSHPKLPGSIHVEWGPRRLTQ